MKFRFKLLSIVLICILAIGCGKAETPGIESEDLQVTTTSGKENNESVAADGQTDSATTSAMATESPTTTEKKPYVLEFESVTIDGEKFTSDCFANSKLTMINVWGTYCGSCLGEMPALGEISDEYDDSVFQIIGVVCDVEDDAGEEYINGVKELVKETKANYTHLLLSDSLLNNLVSSAYYVPTSYFFNQDGEYLGYVESAYPKKTWIQVIESLLEDIE